MTFLQIFQIYTQINKVFLLYVYGKIIVLTFRGHFTFIFL